MILTPVTLWKDFDETLPLCEEVLSEEERDGAIRRELYFLGRQSLYGRVKIYANLFSPAGEKEYPVVMVFFEAGFSADPELVRILLSQGYGVLCVDYCGDTGEGRHTIYPRDIDYANYARAGSAMDRAEPSARETSWYEWAAVARYAARYLREKKEVTRFGALGLRTGGEVLWKIAPYAGLSCLVTVCAAGWLAYRDVEKFAAENPIFDEERHRFIAGIDSQSYAPHVKCPVLMLSAINDKKCNYDRVYDTFQQINPEVEKALLYSAHGNGLIGSHSIANIALFLDKYLKGHAVYLSKPVRSTVFADGEGRLKVRIVYDDAGEAESCGAFYTEKISDFKARDWTRIVGKPNPRENAAEFPLDVYEGSKKILVYTFVLYSNGFSVTSKIQEVVLNNPYRNSCRKSRVIYSGENGTAGFSVFRNRLNSIADCFAHGSATDVMTGIGYGGIGGVSCGKGIISYRVSDLRYEPPHGALFQFDAYSPTDASLQIVFYTDTEEKKGYSYETKLRGGGKWKKILLESGDFKSETGNSLTDFSGVVSLLFAGEGVVVNNVIWL